MSGALGLLRKYEALVVVAIFQTSIFLNWHMVVGVLPKYALDFGVSLAAAGLLISAFTAARILVNFPSGILVDRIGRRPVLLAGGVITALGSLGSGLVPGFNELVVLRFITGVGGAMAITAQGTIIADLSTPLNRARLMSVNEGMIWIGISAGPAVGGILAADLGLRVPFYVVAAFTLATTALTFLRLPETRSRAQAGMPRGPRTSAPDALRELRRDRDFVMINVVSFGAYFTRFGTLFLLLPTLAYSERIGLTLTEFGILAGAVGAVQAVLLPVAGVFADRLGRKTLIVPSTILTGAALIAYGLAPSRDLFLVAGAFYALAAGLAGPAPGAYLADVAPVHIRGIAMGTFRTVGDIAGLTAPLLLGVIAGAVNPGIAIAANGALVVVLGFVFAFLAHETAHGRPHRGLVVESVVAEAPR